MIDSVQHPSNDRPGDEAGIGVQIAGDCAKHRLQRADAKSQIILEGADHLGAGLDAVIPCLQLLDPFLGDHLRPLMGHDLSGQLKLQVPHPVRQAEDLGVDQRSVRTGEDDSRIGRVFTQGAIQQGAMFVGCEVVKSPAPRVGLQLACAANPFDFWPLIERGLAEWSRTSDALIDGAPVEGALDLFRSGLGSGLLDLFLGVPHGAPEKPREIFERLVLPALPVEEAGQVPQPDVGRHPVENVEQVSSETLRRFAPPLFDVVSVFHDYLQGHLLWVAPEYRGRGLVGQYFDAALAVARRHGLNGFMFLSTLPFWERRAPRYGFEARGCIRQPSGPDVIGWFREVC